MDSFIAIPTSTTYTPLSPRLNTVVVEDVVTPIIPMRTVSTRYPRVVTGYGVTSLLSPATAYRYDSGIGENPIAQHDINRDLRYRFLDKWLFKYYQDILRMLKIDDNKVIVLTKSESQNNDISKDSESDSEKKSDFIGNEILTLSKNRKILGSIIFKNNMKWYDLPHNKLYVMKEQAKYVRKKIESMKK